MEELIGGFIEDRLSEFKRNIILGVVIFGITEFFVFVVVYNPTFNKIRNTMTSRCVLLKIFPKQ